jgi:signal transduction histidine kinase
MSRFNIAFSLMSIIPLLTCFYLITVKFFTISVLQGLNGMYFLLALAIALLGLLAGHQLIRDIIRQLLSANAKLERLYNQQAGFVSNVAHEFRSPLMVFKGALDNLGDGLHGSLTQDQMEPVAMCQKEISRLSRLVGDLLDVSRIEAGKLRLSQEDVVLQDILQSVTQFFSAPMKERGLRLTMDVPEHPAKTRGDCDRLKQVFVNLLSNAMKYTHAGGVHIRLTNVDGALQVEIEDTGEGIAREDLERVFDKFERVGSQSEDGAGLGLPIARDLIELHNGRIWAESQLGRGSRFIVRLPASPA